MNKKLMATLAAVLATAGMTAFGQGYIEFSTSGGFVYDDFTTPGTDVKAPGNVTVTFLWAANNATSALGAGIATTGTTSGAGGAASIETMLSSGWTVANNNTTGVEADNTVHASGPTLGGIGYGTFQVTGTSSAGINYEVVVVGWASTEGATLAAALASGGALGWSSAFSYASGSSSTSPLSQFSAAGNGTPFGVAPTPEPTSLALAGLGGLSMLFLRRRKS